MCLISEEEKDCAEKISNTLKYFELAADPAFQKEYINAMFLPAQEQDKYPDTVELLRRLGRIG